MACTKLSKINVEPFEADLDGITEIQKSVFDNAQEFCLWRKGEFDNIVEILQHVSDYVVNHKDLLLAVANTFFAGVAATIALRERLERKRKEKTEQQISQASVIPHIVLAIVSTRTPKNREQLNKFQNLKACVNVIPEEVSGRLRYFVSEKEFCFFFRRAENDFVGFRGSDHKVQDWLIGLFSQDCGED